MKTKATILTIALSSILSSAVIASTGESKDYTFDGSSDEESFVLQGTKTHTEYRYEQVPSTCYREVFDGYETECSSVPVEDCHTTSESCSEVCSGNRPSNRPSGGSSGTRTCSTVCSGGDTVCSTSYETQCDQVAQYHTESYGCYETVKIPYQEFDYNTKATVTLEFGATPMELEAKEEFKVVLNGETISLQLKGSEKIITFKINEEQTAEMNGTTKEINAVYTLAFADKAEAFSATSSDLTELKYEDGKLTFYIGSISEMAKLSTELLWKQQRLLFFGKRKLHKGIVEEKHLTMVEEDDKVKVTIDLKELYPKIRKRKHAFSVKNTLSFDYPILNPKSELPKMENSAKIEKKIKKKIKK